MASPTPLTPRIARTALWMLLTTATILALGTRAHAASGSKAGRMTGTLSSQANGDSPDDTLNYGVYPNTQILLDAWVEYDPYTCTEISAGTWTVTQNPTAGQIATGTVMGQLGNGDCPGDLFTFGAIFYTWTSTKKGVTSDNAAATWTSPDFIVNDVFVINLVQLQINLVSPPPNNKYVIDATPTMPTLTATAQVLYANPDPTPTTQFTWTEKLTVKKGQGGTVDYSSQLQQSFMTTGTAPYTLTLVDPSTIVGGNLQLKITATVNGFDLTAVTPAGLAIIGTNPQRSDIQNQIGADVPGLALHGLDGGDVTDDTERIACQETWDPGLMGQREFKAAADGGTGPVIISSDNGVGIFQLTDPSPFGDPNLLFNWQSNIAQGLSVFSSKIPGANGYPGRLRQNTQYQTTITGTVNPIRVAAGLKPISITPAPAFTKSGLIGSSPTNTLLEDTTRGYNGYAGPRLYGLVLHEFKPDLNFLETVPDSQLPGLGKNPSVWMRVPWRTRGSSGDPNYVGHVTSRSPQCGN